MLIHFSSLHTSFPKDAWIWLSIIGTSASIILLGPSDLIIGPPTDIGAKVHGNGRKKVSRVVISADSQPESSILYTRDVPHDPYAEYTKWLSP